MNMFGKNRPLIFNSNRSVGNTGLFNYEIAQTNTFLYFCSIEIVFFLFTIVLNFK